MNIDPHKLASDGLVHYCGDVDPISHDGFWYDSDEWESNGYANAFRVTNMPDGPHDGMFICLEYITALKTNQLQHAMDSCGLEGDDRNNSRAQIESAIYYGCYDPTSDPYTPAQQLYVIPDDEENMTDCTDFAEIHGADIVTLSQLEAIITEAVAKNSCQP